MFHGARCSSLVFPLLQLSRAARNSEFIELRKCVNYSIATVAAELHSIFARRSFDRQWKFMSEKEEVSEASGGQKKVISIRHSP